MKKSTSILILAFILIAAGFIAMLDWRRNNPYLETTVVFTEIDSGVDSATRQSALERASELEAQLTEDNLSTADTIALYVALAAQNQLLGRLVAADSYMEAAIGLGPSSAALYVTRSRIRYEMQDYTQALELVQRAVELRPNAAQTWWWYGELDENIRRFGTSDSVYNQALIETDYDIDIVIAYTGYLVRDDRPEEAIRVWEGFADRYPESETIANERIQALVARYN